MVVYQHAEPRGSPCVGNFCRAFWRPRIQGRHGGIRGKHIGWMAGARAVYHRKCTPSPRPKDPNPIGILCTDTLGGPCKMNYPCDSVRPPLPTNSAKTGPV